MKDIDRRGLSIGVLRTMMREGKLNGLVKNMIKRLFGCANIYEIQRLRSAEPGIEKLFLELFESGELYEDMKRGFKRMNRIYEDAYFLHYFRRQFGVQKISEELSRSKELDEEVKRALSMAIKSAKAVVLRWLLLYMPNARNLLKELLCTVPKARESARKMLCAEEFDEIAGECNKRPGERCSVHDPISAKGM